MNRSARCHPRTAGFSLLETVVAVAVLAIVASTVLAVLGSTLTLTRDSALRTQTSLLLNYLGRRVAGGDDGVLPSLDDPLTWEYGELGGAFPELSDEGVDPERFRATIVNDGDVVFAGATATGYTLTVCTEGGNGEQCVAASTVGAPPVPAGGSTPSRDFVN